MAEKFMLTTIDNPFNPFTQFREWYEFDVANGYHSSSLLARIVNTSNELSELDQTIRINLAIDEIIRENISGRHKKVTVSSYN